MNSRKVLPYFGDIKRSVILGTPDGFDHGWVVFIAHDPMAGHRYRYSVISVDCQENKTETYAREVTFPLASKIQKEIVTRLVEEKKGTEPRLVRGWGYFTPYP